MKVKTNEMVDNALNSDRKRSLTWSGIKQHVSDQVGCKITKQRLVLMKKYLHELFAEGELVQVTGHGLRGHFKLKPKRPSRKAKAISARPRSTKAHPKGPNQKAKKTIKNVQARKKMASSTPQESHDEEMLIDEDTVTENLVIRRSKNVKNIRKPVKKEGITDNTPVTYPKIVERLKSVEY